MRLKRKDKEKPEQTKLFFLNTYLNYSTNRIEWKQNIGNTYTNQHIRALKYNIYKLSKWMALGNKPRYLYKIFWHQLQLEYLFYLLRHPYFVDNMLNHLYTFNSLGLMLAFSAAISLILPVSPMLVWTHLLVLCH